MRIFKDIARQGLETIISRDASRHFSQREITPDGRNEAELTTLRGVIVLSRSSLLSCRDKSLRARSRNKSSVLSWSRV